jgi:Flp pilus assembly protein TadG
MILGSSFAAIFPALLVLLLFTIAGGVIILVLRKKLKSDFKETTTFTLSELKNLRDEGKMSDEEYERARQSIINQTL